VSRGLVDILKRNLLSYALTLRVMLSNLRRKLTKRGGAEAAARGAVQNVQSIDQALEMHTDPVGRSVWEGQGNTEPVPYTIPAWLQDGVGDTLVGMIIALTCPTE
jgi:hypothetical protein